MTIYKNALGLPDASATIFAQTSPVYSKISGYSLAKVSDAPAMSWAAGTPVTEIINQMQGQGWACVVSKDGHGHALINCTHKDTQAVIDAAVKSAALKFADAEKGFIRFGAIPASGRSINFRDKTQEAGVSVFDAEFTKSGAYRVIVNDVLKVSYLTVMQRDAYRVYGDIIGQGADGEPLLNVKKAVKL